MLKNSSTDNLVSTSAQARDVDDQAQNIVPLDYCVSESFSGDLSTGSILLGEHTSGAHGLSARSSGLLAITRAYSQQERMRVLNIFEEACTRSTRFSFNATILRADSQQIPVLCTGESMVSSDGRSGVIKGVFIFSKALLH